MLLDSSLKRFWGAPRFPSGVISLLMSLLFGSPGKVQKANRPNPPTCGPHFVSVSRLRECGARYLHRTFSLVMPMGTRVSRAMGMSKIFWFIPEPRLSAFPHCGKDLQKTPNKTPAPNKDKKETYKEQVDPDRKKKECPGHREA